MKLKVKLDIIEMDLFDRFIPGAGRGPAQGNVTREVNYPRP